MSAALAAAPALHARDVPPTDLNPAERAAWWHSQCNKLGAEVAIIEAVRDDHRTLDQAADRLDAQVRMPDGESMRDRLERLDAETRRATSDAARRRSNDEHVALYARYVRRMDQLVAQDATLQSRGVRSFAQMNAQLEAAERRWKSQQSRHPLARAERDAACEEDRRALAEADRLASQFAPRPRSSRFRAVRARGSP
jgi:DNA repair exonuclease SbcCD ATPase subunit